MLYCPECETSFDIEDDEVDEGEVITCTECGTDFEVTTIIRSNSNRWRKLTKSVPHLVQVMTSPSSTSSSSISKLVLALWTVQAYALRSVPFYDCTFVYLLSSWPEVKWPQY